MRIRSETKNNTQKIVQHKNRKLQGKLWRQISWGGVCDDMALVGNIHHAGVEAALALVLEELLGCDHSAKAAQWVGQHEPTPLGLAEGLSPAHHCPPTPHRSDAHSWGSLQAAGPPQAL